MDAIFLEADELKQAYEGSYYTILGAGGDLQEWYKGYQDLLNKANIGTISQWYKTTGEEVDDAYDLKGDNRFPEDLTILLFPLDGLDISKLAIFKLKMRDRWFDDVIDNSVDYDDNEDEEEE